MATFERSTELEQTSQAATEELSQAVAINAECMEQADIAPVVHGRAWAGVRKARLKVRV